MKEFFVIAAVTVAVMFTGWGLDVGLGYVQPAWSTPAAGGWYASVSDQTAGQGYVRQGEEQSLADWYPASRAGLHRVAHGRKALDSASSRSYGNRMGHGNYYYCGGMGWGYGATADNPPSRN